MLCVQIQLGTVYRGRMKLSNDDVKMKYNNRIKIPQDYVDAGLKNGVGITRFDLRDDDSNNFFVIVFDYKQCTKYVILNTADQEDL
jgi:hypothetical protein